MRLVHRHPWSLAALASVAALSACDRTEGQAYPPAPAPAAASVTLWTDSTELFMEHPALVVGAPVRFAVHLTDLTDFSAIRAGRLTLRLEPRGGGEPIVVRQEAPTSPGIYGPAPTFRRAGVYDLTLTLESAQARDVMRVADLRVHATAEEAPEEGGAPSGISFGKEQQWKAVGFATAFPTPGTIEESFQAIGRVVPAGGGVASVAAPIAAMVDAAGATRSPAPGERVRKGQALAVLTPALGETGSALAQARAALHEAEDEHARAKRLYEVEAVSQRRLHEAEIRLRAAREALSTFGDEVARADGRIVLRAPIDGVVASRRLVPGGHVEAGTELFRVIDPTVVWLEVNVTAADAARIGSGSRATFRVPGTEATHSVRRAVSTGSVIDSVSRTILVIYEVANPDGILKIGMSAQVAVGTGQRVSGLVIPTSAVLDEDGRPIAYVQTEGELFEKRYLTVAATGGDRTLVRAGITAGERVVTGEAYQVRLASLSTSVPAHGHAH